MPVKSPAMPLRLPALIALAAGLFAAVSGCGAGPDKGPAPRADWVIESHVAFLEADAKTPRKVNRVPLRLWVPYVVGDIYGNPNEGELSPVSLRPDLSFTIDLNQRHERLAKALIPTAFSQKWMKIEPASARVARVSPFLLPEDGIAPVGMSEWLDGRTRQRLLLIYIDRPARIRGEIVHQGRSLSFDIDAKQAGYLWVSQPDGSGVYQAVPTPADLVLAVMPNA